MAFFIVGTVLAIALAIFLNEITSSKMSRVYQTIILLPYLMSWVVVGYLAYAFMSGETGLINNSILKPLGLQPINFYQDATWWPLILVLVNTWKKVGYSMIIYFSSIVGISTDYYEAARIDGASGLQQFFKITVPLLTPTIFFLLVTRIIAAFNQYDMVYMMADSATSGAVGPITDSLRTLVFGVYQSAFADMQMGYACAKAVFLFFVILIVTAIQMIGEKRWVNY